MRAQDTLLILVALGLLLPPAWAPPARAESSARDWSVQGQEDRSNETIYMEGNLTVLPGGRLSLVNVILYFNCSGPGALGLEVQGGGELELRSSTIASNTSEPYLFRALSGSKITISNSRITDAGTCSTVPELSGPCIGTDLARVDNSTFMGNAAGICFLNTEAEVTDCQMMQNGVGALLHGSRGAFDRCRFDQNSGRDVVLGNGSLLEELDCALNLTAVEILDAASVLNVSWSLEVGVYWDNGSPAQGALVQVAPADSPPRLFQADPAGRVTDIRAVSTTVRSGGRQEHGPFNISTNISTEAKTVSAWSSVNISQPTQVLLRLDATPPFLAVDHPAEGEFLNSSTVTFKGRARDEFPPSEDPWIERVEARLDAGDWVGLNETGEWSITFTDLKEGAHTFDARAWDLVGNLNETSVHFQIDLTPPTLEIWPPDGHLTAQPNITLRILSDAENILVNGTPQTAFRPGSLLEVDWPLELEGPNLVVVEALDAANNSARKEVLVVRDTTPPGILITWPPASALLDSAVVVVRGGCSDEHGVALVESSLDRTNWTRCSGNASWNATVVLSGGENILWIRATDTLGNANLSFVQVTVRLPDVIGPELEVLSPADRHQTSTDSIEVTGRANDSSGVRLVQLGLDNSSWVNATGTESWRGELVLSAGWNRINVRAIDLAGNVNSTAISVWYQPPPPDTSPPSLTLLYPPAGLKVSDRKLVISGKASDPSGVSYVEVSIDGRDWAGCILTGEDWSGIVTLSPGNNTIVVRAFDSGGNRATASTFAFLEIPNDPQPERLSYILALVAVLLTMLAFGLIARSRSGRIRPVKSAPAEGAEEE